MRNRAITTNAPADSRPKTRTERTLLRFRPKRLTWGRSIQRPLGRFSDKDRESGSPPIRMLPSGQRTTATCGTGPRKAATSPFSRSNTLNTLHKDCKPERPDAERPKDREDQQHPPYRFHSRHPAFR